MAVDRHTAVEVMLECDLPYCMDKIKEGRIGQVRARFGNVLMTPQFFLVSYLSSKKS